MEHSAVHTTTRIEEDDEWDTDGFVIPSLGIEDSDQRKLDAVEVESSKTPPPEAKKEENIYLGPHGAPPSHPKHQELNSSNRKQRFKQKLKEAGRRTSVSGLENKVEICESLWAVVALAGK